MGLCHIEWDLNPAPRCWEPTALTAAPPGHCHASWRGWDHLRRERKRVCEHKCACECKIMTWQQVFVNAERRSWRNQKREKSWLITPCFWERCVPPTHWRSFLQHSFFPGAKTTTKFHLSDIPEEIKLKQKLDSFVFFSVKGSKIEHAAFGYVGQSGKDLALPSSALNPRLIRSLQAIRHRSIAGSGGQILLF